MLLIRHIFQSLYAAWRLLQGDASAIELYEPTLSGFLKSFLAAIICLPLYAIMINLVGPTADGIIYTFFFLLSWVITPVVMYPVLKLLQLEDRFFHLIIAGNWAQVVILSVFLLGSLVLTILPNLAALQAGFGLLMFAVMLYYIWFVVRTALGSSGGVAAAIVLLDTLTNMVLRYTLLGT